MGKVAIIGVGQSTFVRSYPGSIREQFKVTLPRLRDINSVELARYATEITAALKGGAGTPEEYAI